MAEDEQPEYEEAIMYSEGRYYKIIINKKTHQIIDMRPLD